MYACVCVCMHAYMQLCMYAYMRVCMSACICLCVFACMCVCLYVRMYVRTHVCKPPRQIALSFELPLQTRPHIACILLSHASSRATNIAPQALHLKMRRCCARLFLAPGYSLLWFLRAFRLLAACYLRAHPRPAHFARSASLFAIFFLDLPQLAFQGVYLSVGLLLACCRTNVEPHPVSTEGLRNPVPSALA